MSTVYITFHVTTKEYSRRRQKMTFESLLVKELQKQQSRAEFCDVVLHTQGVSVPVHSCVLSAFSPWLCGALSVMPSPGKKRLIEVQAVESCTLLSLVTLLYSGQLSKDKQEVLSAACKLGITIPQQNTTAAEQKGGRQAGTQTEYTKMSMETECQTDVHYTTAALTLFSECPHPKETVETVNVIGVSSWRSNQGLDPYATASDFTLTTLQNVQGIPEKISSLQLMDVVPETSMYPTVSAPACVPQGYVCPQESSTDPLPPYPYPPYSTSQGQSALGGVLQGGEYDLGGLEQFENNIPAFINHFLHANSTQAAEQIGQSQRRSRGGDKTEGKTRRASIRGNCAIRWEGGSIRKTDQNMHRFGRVAKSVWIGQGGGRVGRMLDTRHVLKHQGRFNRRQGRGVSYKVDGERGRSSSRGRPRKRQAESRDRLVEPVCQDQAPPIKRSRGRPRKHPLPSQNAARSGTSPIEQKATNPPAPSLIHTAALPADNQPLDWLLDDVIAQLPFMPPIASGIQNNQEEIDTASLNSHLKTKNSVKITDLSVVQPQPEGELTEILDSFLRTFDQHVGTCDSDVMPDRSQSGITDRTTGAYHQSAQNYMIQIDASNLLTRNDPNYSLRASINTTQLGPTASLSQNRPRGSARRAQKPSFSSEVPGRNIKKLKRQQSEKSETHRKTRSRRRKKELKTTEELREEVLPAKRSQRIRKQGLERQGASLLNKNTKPVQQTHFKKIHTSCKTDSRCDVASALSKAIGKPNACKVKYSAQSTRRMQKILDWSSTSELHGQKKSGCVKEQVGHAKSNRDNMNLKGSRLRMDGSTVSSQPSQSVTKNTFTGSHSETSLSAFEFMKNLLENQRNKEGEQNKGDHGRRTAGRLREKGKPQVDTCVKRAELTRDGKRAQTSNHTTSPLVLPKGQRERLSSYSKPTLDTVDSLSESSFQSSLSESSVCSTKSYTLTNIAAMPTVSHAADPAVPFEEQSVTDSSEEDVDVDEVSGTLSELSHVLPLVADIVISTEEEDEEAEIDILDSP